MKISPHLTAAACFLLAACDNATPENYFDRAVLNANLMQGFAGRGLRFKLENPSAMLKPGTKDETVVMTRQEVIETDLAAIEANYGKVKKLRLTDDTRAMVEASLALYEYVLPVYRNEYRQLAQLYDHNAPRLQVDALAREIEVKYGPGFADRFDRLTEAGKPYAARHGIKVNWGIKTAP